MLFLALAVVCSTVVIHTFRFAQVRQFSVDRLLFVNYAIAAGAGWVQAATGETGLAELNVPALAGLFGLALGTGLLFIGNFLLLNRAITALGPSLAGAASRMSAVIPVALSMVVFSELPGPWGWAGMALALLALLITALPAPQAGPALTTALWFPALAVFVGFGVNDFMLKIQNDMFPAATKPLFFAVVYTTAWAVSAIRLTGKQRQGRGAWVGALLGLANYGSAIFFSWSLGQLTGTDAYALNAVGVIALVTITSALIWKEKLTGRVLAFGALAAAAVWFIQFKG